MNELSPEAKRLIEALRAAREPEEARLERVRDALLQRLAGDGGAAGEDASGVPGAFASSLGALHRIGIAVVLAAAGTFVASQQTRETEGVASSSRTESAREARERGAPQPAVETTARSPGLPEDRFARAPAQKRQAQPKSPERATKPRKLRAAPEDSAPARMTAGPFADDDTHTTTEDPEPEVEQRLTADARDAETRVQPAVEDTSLMNELKMIRAASSALDQHDGERSLALLEQHAASYPRGMLLQERLALRVLALCALGRTDAAQSARSELGHVAPRSPYWMRIEVGCKPTKSRARLR